MKLLRRTTSEIVEEVKQVIAKPVKSHSIRFDKTVSTGSTLLDLAASGGKVKGGGIPGGIVMEIFGPPSAGKTAILSEIIASVQARGGDAEIDDPEGRMDEEYAIVYGMEINKHNYSRSNTVTEVFDKIRGWSPQPRTEGAICARGIDSLAALSTDMEMKGEDKYGMRRAKEFSEGLRRVCRILASNNWLIVCTNQTREGGSGEITPGGKGIPYYSSLRIRVAPSFPSSNIERKADIHGKEVKKVIGIKSMCKIVKSTIDDPFRTAEVNIIFGVGVDDIRANLQYYKDMMGLTRYMAVNREFQAIDRAITHIEENNLEGQLKEKVITLWEEIEEKFKMERKKKVRE